jgi:hypothetical protein
MQRLIVIFLVFCLFSACDQESTSKKSGAQKEEITLNFLQKVAHAHGFENWNAVNELKFTFAVHRDSSYFERRWHWNVKDEWVTRYIGKDSIQISLKDNTYDKQVHQAYINDTYWLLFPFHLQWTEDYEWEISEHIPSPIDAQNSTEISIKFNDLGGYTPGDLYKLYVNDEYLIQEWAFYSGGSETPNLLNKWEAYNDFKGVKISQSRPNEDQSFRIELNDIEIKTNE